MFFSAFRVQPSNFSSLTKALVNSSYLPVRTYAARKGTRERKQKKIVKKVVVEKPKFIPHNLRNKELLLASRPSLKFDDTNRPVPQDDVYVMKLYKWKVYPFQEAIHCLRETHHPEMYNVPNAELHVRIELNAVGDKPTRLVDDFHSIALIPHRFDHGEERAILAFSKSTSAQKEALDAGAQLAGGIDLIKQIQNGTVSLKNFQYIVAQPDILPELVPLRGLLKRRFPSPKLGTLDMDLGGVTEKFIKGISYSAKKDEYEKDFGLVETVIGTLEMDSGHLEENFAALVRDVERMRPKRGGDFITRCLLTSPPSPEKFKVDHNLYLPRLESGNEVEVEEEQTERVAL